MLFRSTTVANEVVRSPATLVGALGAVVWTAYTESGVTLVLVSLAVVPLSVLPIRYVGKKLIKRAGQIQSELGAVTKQLEEAREQVDVARLNAQDENKRANRQKKQLDELRERVDGKLDSAQPQSTSALQAAQS